MAIYDFYTVIKVKCFLKLHPVKPCFALKPKFIEI